MKEKEEILKRLDDIVFHDMPVEKISFKTQYSTDFIIDFALYLEDKKDYAYWTIEFLGIKQLKSNRLELNDESELEIFGFDYELKELYNCKLSILTGFGGLPLEIELECEKIELNKTMPNKSSYVKHSLKSVSITNIIFILFST